MNLLLFGCALFYLFYSIFIFTADYINDVALCLQKRNEDECLSMQVDVSIQKMSFK